MKKAFGIYTVCWVLFFAAFNIIAFTAPALPLHEKYTPTFWWGYALITVALIGQLLCTYFALKPENAAKRFYKLPMITLSWTGIIVSFIVGVYCKFYTMLPDWLCLAICGVILALYAFAVFGTAAAAGIVEEKDAKLAAKTSFIKNLTAEASALIAHSQTADIKAECEKVYEAIRYSDPMSSDALADVEAQLADSFAEFSHAVNGGNTEEVGEIAARLLVLIGDRNAKCKAMK